MRSREAIKARLALAELVRSAKALCREKERWNVHLTFLACPFLLTHRLQR